MSKSYKIVLGALILLLSLLVYMEANKPKPLNWFPSYGEQDKIPLGTYLFFDQLKQRANNIQFIEEAPYLRLSDSMNTLGKGTYFFISPSLYFDQAELSKLLDWVDRGNTLFLAADDFKGNLLDTLSLEQEARVQIEDLTSYPQFNLVNPNLKTETPTVFTHDKNLMFFSDIDTLRHQVLGIGNLMNQNDSTQIAKPLVNFVKAPFGEGNIYLHSSPEVFSNYFMLTKDNYRYVEGLLAYIDREQAIFWDKKYSGSKTIHLSLLYVLLNNPYLKAAYYTLIFGTLIFIYFEGKRKQKSIRVIPRLENQTYNYTRTIAGMYLDKADHKSVAEKQIDTLLYEIREGMRIDVQTIDENLYDKLAERTELPKAEIQQLFTLIQRIQQQKHISKDQLKQLHEQISNFKKHSY